MGKVTTHVLDTASGKPAENVRIVMFNGENNEIIADIRTNDDGRCDGPLLSGDDLKRGTYRLEFHVGEYFKAQKNEHVTDIPFLDIVPVAFGIDDANGHYHVPLLISPFSYSTYRGS